MKIWPNSKLLASSNSYEYISILRQAIILGRQKNLHSPQPQRTDISSVQNLNFIFEGDVRRANGKSWSRTLILVI